jgi:hypothetical protein
VEAVRVREMKAEIKAAERDVEAARDKYTQACARALRPQDAAEVARPLTSYLHAVQFGQREADPREEARLRRELVEEMTSHGFVFKPRDTRHPTAGFEIHDPSLEPAERAAEAELRAAERELARVTAEHAEAIERADEAQAIKEFRERIASDDPEKVAAAFEAVDAYKRRAANPSGAMTTADLGAAVR